ncbi:Putative F pilin acetylation protein, partial [Candidatus Arthromitus sp. SFB-5]
MSAFTLKSIAFVLMILDHIFYYIVDVPIFF